MEITINHDSVVDKRTGEVSAPSEYLENLRELEVRIQRLDEELEGLKAELKRTKDARDTAVTRLRSSVREGSVLPLLEVEDEEPTIPEPEPEPEESGE